MFDLLGYAQGRFAPGCATGRRAGGRPPLLLSHGSPLPALRRASVGITLNLSPVHPAAGRGDEAAARRSTASSTAGSSTRSTPRLPEDVLEHRPPRGPMTPIRAGDLEAIAAPIDFLGVNYYSPRTRARTATTAARRRLRTRDRPLTAMGWEVYPDGLSSC